MTSPKNILIVRTDRIGDVVLSLPLASILKKHFPECRISFLLREYTKPLAENNSYIDEVIVLSGSNGYTKIWQNIKQLKNKYDVCIVAYPTFSVALILFLSKIKLRIGTGYRWYSFLFNRKFYEHRKFGERNELEYNVRLLQKLGIDEKVNVENVSFGIKPSKECEEKVLHDLRELGVSFSKPLIAVHPGTGGSAINLPIEKLWEIVNFLSLDNFEILITGSKSEKELCESLVVSKRIINTAGRYNLSEFIALLNNTDLLLANSTGPIHIAAALGKYVIGFYPKIVACSPKRWGPYTDKKVIFSPAIDCSDCNPKQCEKLNCMDSINPDEVIESVKNILSRIAVEQK
jgi:lipopolysaccharide heptosyltransferase II